MAQYLCDRAVVIDGVWIDARMPFWTDAAPEEDWQLVTDDPTQALTASLPVA